MSVDVPRSLLGSQVEESYPPRDGVPLLKKGGGMG